MRGSLSEGDPDYEHRPDESRVLEGDASARGINRDLSASARAEILRAMARPRRSRFAAKAGDAGSGIRDPASVRHISRLWLPFPRSDPTTTFLTNTPARSRASSMLLRRPSSASASVTAEPARAAATTGPPGGGFFFGC